MAKFKFTPNKEGVAQLGQSVAAVLAPEVNKVVGEVHARSASRSEAEIAADLNEALHDKLGVRISDRTGQKLARRLATSAPGTAAEPIPLYLELHAA